MHRNLPWIIVALVTLAGCGDTPEFLQRPTSTPTGTPTSTPSPSVTSTPTRRPTPTATPVPIIAPVSGAGANIGFFGVLRADDTLIDPSGTDAAGRPVYTRLNGAGFLLVIDAKPGTNGAPVRTTTYNYKANDPTVRPDLQIEVTRDLGNGSTAVCDNSEGRFGGVPGIDPPSFDLTQPISDALNDFGCRFDNGAGQTMGRMADSACVLFSDGEFRFVDPDATVEFCGTITHPLAFPGGDTVVTARVRDQSDIVGPEQQIVIHVDGP